MKINAVGMDILRRFFQIIRREYITNVTIREIMDESSGRHPKETTDMVLEEGVRDFQKLPRIRYRRKEKGYDDLEDR